MASQRILITGAGGFIGSGLYNQLKSFKPLGVDFGIPDSSQSELLKKIDLSDQTAVKALFKEYQPDTVFHLAALTSPQRNEENKLLAKVYNLDVTQNVLDNLQSDTHLIFLSTDKIFDGKDPNPDEKAEPNPLWVYADYKWQCEKLIYARVKKYHVFRLPIVHSYGESKALSLEAGPGSFLDKALNDLKEGKQVSIFDNVYRCFLKRMELIKLFEQVLDDTHYGTYHVGSRMMSYYDRLRMLCEEKNISCSELLLPKKGEAKPLKQNLNTNKLKNTFGVTLS